MIKPKISPFSVYLDDDFTWLSINNGNNKKEIIKKK